MKEFVGGIMFASGAVILGCSMYELGKIAGRRENGKVQKKLSDEMIKILEAIRVKFESI